LWLAKKHYYEKNLSVNKWSSKTNNNNKIETIISNGILLNVSVNTKMVSNIFNEFFINIGKKLVNNSSKMTLNDIKNTRNTVFFFFFYNMFFL